MKKAKKITILFLALVTIMSSSATAFANENITVTNLPITDEFVNSENEKRISDIDDYKYDSDFNEVDSLENQKKPTVTYLPISSDFINNENQKALERYYDSTTENNTRSSTIPEIIWNNSDGTCKRSGSTQYQPLYTSYKFMCGANQQLHIKGSMLVAEAQTEDLHIEVINANDNTVTHVYIEPTDLNSYQYPFETGYYFNFNIGPLNKNHAYYLKFNTFSSVFNYFGHDVSYEITAI